MLQHIVNARVLAAFFTAREDREFLHSLLPEPDQDILQGLEQGPEPEASEAAR